MNKIIEKYIDTVLPMRIRRRWVVTQIALHKFPYKTEVALRAYSEHDALHYLTGETFTSKSEGHIAYLENKFNCGWLPLGKEFNTSIQIPFDCNNLTKELITETAQLFYEIYDDYEDKEYL